jgi:hypothetical protein
MPKQVCLTREEWAARGADVAAAESADKLAANPQATNQN